MIESILKNKPKSIFEFLDKECFKHDIGIPHHDEYIFCENYYEIYFAISKFFKPTSIFEIGVRYGYSLLSLIYPNKGNIEKVIGWDNDYYGSCGHPTISNSLGVARENIKSSFPSLKFEILNNNSQSFSSLSEEYVFDIIHIDGDHTISGKTHDLNLIKNAFKKCLIIDDYKDNNIKKVTDDFVENNNFKNTLYIDSIRGTFLVIK